jgi:hypothetical protein
MQQFCTYGSVRGASGQPASLPRQKPHLLRCARSLRSLSCSWFVLVFVLIHVSRFTITMATRLASEIFLNSLRKKFSAQIGI